jgi:hypothetical protein
MELGYAAARFSVFRGGERDDLLFSGHRLVGVLALVGTARMRGHLAGPLR